MNENAAFRCGVFLRRRRRPWFSGSSESLPNDVVTCHQPCSLGVHSGHGGDRVACSLVDATAAVGYQDGFKSQSECVQHGELDTVVSCQSHHKQAYRSVLAEVFFQPGTALASVVKKTAVTIDVWVGPFGKDMLYSLRIQLRGEFGPGSFLDAMDRPQYLWNAMQLEYLAYLVSGVVRRKTGVMGRMPILSSKCGVKVLLQLVGDTDDLVTMGYW